MGLFLLYCLHGRLPQLSKVLCKYRTSAPVLLCQQHLTLKEITNATHYYHSYNNS